MNSSELEKKIGAWSHVMCEECWVFLRTGVPYRTISSPAKKCCYCDKESNTGIYVRGNPATTPCKGQHVDRWITVVA